MTEPAQFKVGDRVRLLSPRSRGSPFGKFSKEGRRATIVSISVDYSRSNHQRQMIRIQFDVKRKGATPHCLNIYWPTDLEKIDD
jgi:hypothetical protein